MHKNRFWNTQDGGIADENDRTGRDGKIDFLD